MIDVPILLWRHISSGETIVDTILKSMNFCFSFSVKMRYITAKSIRAWPYQDLLSQNFIVEVYKEVILLGKVVGEKNMRSFIFISNYIVNGM